MPTIHVSSDAATIGRIVEVLLTYGNRVQFHGDNDDRFDVGTSEAWQAAIDPSYETRTEAGLRLMEEIAAHEREQAWARADERFARRQVADQEYGFNLGVPCPHCGSPTDAPCIKPSGQDHKRPYVHSVRRRDARKATWNPDETIDDWGPAAEATRLAAAKAVVAERVERNKVQVWADENPFPPVTLDEMDTYDEPDRIEF